MDYHRPVLLDEVLSYLNPGPSKTFIDCTLGHGGHTQAILKKGSTVYGIDMDPTNLEIVSKRFNSDNFHPINDNFSNLKQIIDQNLSGQSIDGILFDLGLNSLQQTTHHRGFSFNDPSSLDMRLDPQNQDVTAEFIINTWDHNQLVSLFSKVVQEKLSKPIAIEIVKNRQKQPIKSGVVLADIIRNTYKKYHQKSSLDPATKVFLALRIAVNHEFENLTSALEATLTLNKGCTVVVISFHSGEDRLVKNFIRSHSVENLTKKPITPSLLEIKSNPLSRSSILRSYRIV